MRGTRFPPAASYETPAAIAAHLAELRAVIEAAPAPAADAVEAALMKVREALAEGPDHGIQSGAPLLGERHHTEVQKDPQAGSWSGGGGEDALRDARATAPGASERSPREEGIVAAEHAQAPGRGRAEGTEDAGKGRPDPGGAKDQEGYGDREPGEVPASRLSPALLRRLTPCALRDLGSEDLRLYADNLEPPGTPVTLRTLERAALLRRQDLGIGPEAWEEAEASLGWIDALVALVVVDRNRDHPTNPVRNPGGLLRDLARRRRAGTFDLGASVMGIWRREEGAASVGPDGRPEAR